MADLHLKAVEPVQIQKRAPVPLGIVFPGDQRSPEGTHQPGDVGPHYVLIGNLLEGAQHRVIVEGTALDNDILAQILGIMHLDNLLQGVLDNRIG